MEVTALYYGQVHRAKGTKHTIVLFLSVVFILVVVVLKLRSSTYFGGSITSFNESRYHG